MRKYLVSFTVCLLIGTLRLLGQEVPPIETDRPGESQSPSIVLKKHLQVESGFEVEKTDNSSTHLYPSTLWRYGVGESFEFRLITELTTQKEDTKNITGLNPVKIGFKLNVSKEKGILPATSFSGYLQIPDFATSGLKTTYYAPAFRFIMQHTLSKKFNLGYNLGAKWDGETTDPIFVYTVNGAYSISDKWTSFVELYGFVAQESGADHRIDAGLAYEVMTNMQIDFSGGIGITTNSPNYFTAIGFSFRLKD